MVYLRCSQSCLEMLMMSANSEQREFRLVSFTVRNFRTFVDETLHVERDATVLVGRNDTGKSSLLQALWLYGQVTSDGFRTVADTPELGDSPSPVEFLTTWRELDTGEMYEHEVHCDPKRPEERLSWQGEQYTWIPTEKTLLGSDRAFAASQFGRYASLGSIDQSDWLAGTEVPPATVNNLSAPHGFGIPRPQLFEPTQLATSVPLEIESMYPGGAGWAGMLQSIINRRDGSLESLENRIRDLFPFFHRVTVVEERYEVTRKVVGLDQGAVEAFGFDRADRGQFLERYAEHESMRRVIFEVPPPGARGGDRVWIPANQVSSGLLLCLAYMTIALSSPSGNLLVLEEPENGLNRTVATKMMESFLDLVRDRDQQLIMTTHNPFWLDVVGPQGVRVVVRDASGSHIRYDPANFERIRDEGFYLSEMMSLGGPEQLLEKRRAN